MAKQIGRLLLIKAGDGESPEVFTNVCGFTSSNLNLSPNMVEVTTPKCSDPSALPQRTVMPGVIDLSFSGSGTFDNDAVGKQMLDDSLAGTVRNYQVVIPGWGTLEGPYHVSVTLAGEMEGAVTFDATFDPAGEITFAAEV